MNFVAFSTIQRKAGLKCQGCNQCQQAGKEGQRQGRWIGHRSARYKLPTPQLLPRTAKAVKSNLSDAPGSSAQCVVLHAQPPPDA